MGNQKNRTFSTIQMHQQLPSDLPNFIIYAFDFMGSYTSVLYAIVLMLIITIGCVVAAFKGKKKLEQEGLWK